MEKNNIPLSFVVLLGGKYLLSKALEGVPQVGKELGCLFYNHLSRSMVLLTFYLSIHNWKCFQFFCGSIENGPCVGSDTCKSKTVYIWIFLDPMQVGPIMGVIVFYNQFLALSFKDMGKSLSWITSPNLKVSYFFKELWICTLEYLRGCMSHKIDEIWSMLKVISFNFPSHNRRGSLGNSWYSIVTKHYVHLSITVFASFFLLVVSLPHVHVNALIPESKGTRFS